MKELNRILDLPQQQKLGVLAGLIIAVLLLDYFLLYSPHCIASQKHLGHSSIKFIDEGDILCILSNLISIQLC